MRIALVIRRLAGLRGGAERVVCELAEALEGRGHDVTIVTYEAAVGAPAFDIGGARIVDLFPNVLRFAGGRTVRPGRTPIESAVRDRFAGRVADRVKWELTHGWYARRLASWLRANSYDAVVGYLPPAISAVGLAAERLDIRPPVVVASTHSLPSLDFDVDGRWDPSPRARAMNLRALGNVDVVTVLQQAFVDELPQAVRANAVVIPNSVTTRGVGPSEPDRVVLGVGRLVDTKRYDLLIEAFAAAAGRLDGWRLRLCGDGPERASLEGLARDLGVGDRVEFAGVVDDVAAEYRRANMLVHPSAFEGFGLVVAEAILHGVPVVVSAACSGIGDLVIDGVTGRLVNESDTPADAFADAIADLAEHPLSRGPFESAAESLSRRLDPDLIVSCWEDVLRPRRRSAP